MDFGYTPEDAAGRFGITDTDMGTSFDPDTPASTHPNTFMADDMLYRRFLSLVERSPEWGWRAGKALGLSAFVMPSERPEPMPAKGITSIEVSFGDRGERKVVRQRDDRAGARFDASIQVSTVKSRGVSSASFRGRVDFYSPARALAKAVELAKPTKCQTPFSTDYLAFVTELIEAIAKPSDMLVGFVHTKPGKKAGGGGTFYHDRQIMVASRAGLEAHSLSDAVIFLGSDSGATAIRLPATSVRTSKGKALGGNYAMQSRGVAKAGQFSETWETGVFKMQRLSAT